MDLPPFAEQAGSPGVTSVPGDTSVAEREPVVLQKLSQRHKQVLALVAQGVSRTVIGQACDYEPEYITWLVRQQVCQVFLREMIGFNDSRLLALTERSVDVISDAMRNGTVEDQLKAAKLQLTAIGKVGRANGQSGVTYDEDRLERLAGRLESLLDNAHGHTYAAERSEAGTGNPVDVSDAELVQ